MSAGDYATSRLAEDFRLAPSGVILSLNTAATEYTSLALTRGEWTVIMTTSAHNGT